jgi:hypothetical protein
VNRRSLPPVEPRPPKLPNDPNMGEVPRRGSFKPLEGPSARAIPRSRRFPGEDAAIPCSAHVGRIVAGAGSSSSRLDSRLAVRGAGSPFVRCRERVLHRSRQHRRNARLAPSQVGFLHWWTWTADRRAAPAPRAPSGQVKEAETSNPMHVETALRAVSATTPGATRSRSAFTWSNSSQSILAWTLTG